MLFGLGKDIPLIAIDFSNWTGGNLYAATNYQLTSTNSTNCFLFRFGRKLGTVLDPYRQVYAGRRDTCQLGFLAKNGVLITQ